jgi:hypothetical protein
MVEMRLLLVAFGCVTLALGPSCGRTRPPVSVTPGPSSPADEVESVALEPSDDPEPISLEVADIDPIPMDPVEYEPSLLELADADFAAGRFAAAATSYETLLRVESAGSATDRVRYRLGLILAGPESPLFDPGRAVELFRSVDGASDGGRSAEAGLLVELLLSLNTSRADVEKSRSELRRVSDELERLKAIDQERRRGRIP